jgi:hypothetical protein
MPRSGHVSPINPCDVHAYEVPNAGRQPLGRAGATEERTLEAVRSTPLFDRVPRPDHLKQPVLTRCFISGSPAPGPPDHFPPWDRQKGIEMSTPVLPGRLYLGTRVLADPPQPQRWLQHHLPMLHHLEGCRPPRRSWRPKTCIRGRDGAMGNPAWRTSVLRCVPMHIFPP